MINVEKFVKFLFNILFFLFLKKINEKRMGLDYRRGKLLL